VKTLIKRDPVSLAVLRTAKKLLKANISNIFPCVRLKHLDKRYRVNYATSAISNLLSIKENGINNFVEKENKKWICPECGVIICMHIPQCLSCGHVWYTSGEIK
jgi:ribosomal protein S27AE